MSFSVAMTQSVVLMQNSLFPIEMHFLKFAIVKVDFVENILQMSLFL